MPAPPRVLWSVSDWCDAIAELPTRGPLPQRTVLVPNSRVLHALRRELINRQRPELLIGSEFVPLARALAELFAAAGEPTRIHQDATLRPARLLAVLAGEPELEYFDAGAMRATPGWAEAFCDTLTDLEGADLTPDTLPTTDKRWRDVATIWRHANALASGASIHQAVARAADLLAVSPEAWPFAGATLATVTTEITAVEARLFGTIPEVELAVLAGRPLHPDGLARLSALFGSDVAATIARAEPTRTESCERDILAAYLFEDPARLLDPERPRSGGRDHTVELEDHAGVDEELEAAVTWACERIVAGTALADIALLLPTLDPMAALVRERLGRLPEAPAVFVAGGLPITTLGSGARILDVVRALGEWLSANALASVVPHLRDTAGEAIAISPSAAVQTVWSVGTGGGSHAHREAALRWPERLAIRIADLDIEIAKKSVGEDDAVQSGHARETRAAQTLVARLRAVQPGVQALATIAGQVLGGAPLATLVSSLLTWIQQHLFVPEEHEPVVTVIEEALADLAETDPSRELVGSVALRVIADTIASSRYRVGRVGEPAIYVGTVHGALGLSFAATRVLGLAEGTLPGAAREDPLLPEALKATAELALPRASQRNLAGLHALDWTVRNSARLCLSAPRSDSHRTSKEPSGIFVDVATALGRSARAVPRANDLHHDCFAPARAHITALRDQRPLSETAWQDRLARHGDLLPPAWLSEPSRDPLGTRARHGTDNGILGTATPTPHLPGLTARRAISPTRLGSLLGCPLRFVFESLLGWSEPATPPLQREIVQPYYGSLLHLAHETFFDAYGAAFGDRKRSLEHWQRRGASVADDAFNKFLHEYPLTGTAIQEQQRKRLLDDFARLLAHDWDHGAPRSFHSTERGFGFDTPLALPVGGVTLYVRGRIDRIDVRDGVTQIRDLKSGKPHPRIGDERQPHPSVDLQIALYTMVANAHADDWQLPRTFEATYLYPKTDVYPERTFTEDVHELLAAAQSWMSIGHALMAARSFPQTPDPHGCDYCAFAPVCGNGANARAAEMLKGADAARHPELAAFAALHGIES